MDIKNFNNEEKKEIIKKFLEGSDEQKYITAIEGDYYSNEVTLLIEDPEKGKSIEKHKFTPFAFVKDFKKLNKQLYKTKKELKDAMNLHGITIKSLRTDDHPRLEYGYKFIITTSKKLVNIIQFFSKAGYDVFKSYDNLFICNSGVEQFLLTTGKRLFKGFETYDSIHKFYFDIETTGLNPFENNTFLIGMKDNRGFRKVLTLDLNNPIESEKQMIIDFFQTIIDLRPTIVAGYNSEAFDFYFLLERAKILGIDLGDRRDEDNNRIYDVLTSYNIDKPLRRKSSTFKHGSETEHYEQTIMWGINVIDISHGVKKAMAINSDIKGWGLKYICKYSDIAKEDRMYVKDGGTIYKIWEANKWYFINKKNNSYKEIHPNHQATPQEYKHKLIKWVVKGTQDGVESAIKRTSDFFNGDPENVDIICGKDIIYEYLLDDLTETEMVDNLFNESAFMLGKIAPTGYVRAATMGNASLWRLLMITYSYLNNLAVPCTDLKRDIVGGLSRLVRTGFAKNVIKYDFTSLYPGIQLTHDVFPDLDITGVLEAILTYFRDSRIEFKGLSKKYKDAGNKVLAKLFDTKQLPIKILANSNFGAISSPAIFNWGDNNIGERITCTGRLYLRLMIKHFMKYGFKPLVMDTDGVNFSLPDNIDEITYINKKGEVLTGHPAVLAEFNDKYMTGVMNLEEDGMYAATINFSRKNYANLTYQGKVKLTGASIKSKTIQTYIEEFLDKGIKMLLIDGNAKKFVDEYYDYLTLIYNKQIPLAKIANKKKVKEKVADYKWAMANTTQKNGRTPAKKAHMELLIEKDLNPDLGEVILFINNGTVKSHGDTGHSYIINLKDLEDDPDKLGEYNVPRYISSFNKKLQPLLVCLSPEVRKTLLVDNPKKRQFYTDLQLELVSGIPLKIEQQDPLNWDEFIVGEHENEPVLEMSESEIKYWNKSGLNPTDIFDGFTTKLCEFRLLTQDEQRQKNREIGIIKNWFKENRTTVKTEMEFLLDGDEVIMYKTDFTTFTPNKDKETMKNKPWIEDKTKFEDFKWVLSKFEVINKGTPKVLGRFNDLEIIDDQIYKGDLILTETANR